MFEGRVCSFSHESLFDYAFARRFVARQGSVATWLRHDTNARRVAAVKAVFALASQIYNDAFYAPESGLPVPELLAKREQAAVEPQPPSA